MANTVGTFVDIDGDIKKKSSYDIARILIRTRSLGIISEMFYITINGIVFPIKMVEEWCGPLRRMSRYQASDEMQLESDSEGGDNC